MPETDIVQLIKDHKEELICIGAASICYNLIQFLRKKNNNKKPATEKPIDVNASINPPSIRFDTSTRQLSK